MSTLAEQVVEQLKTDMDNVYDAGYTEGYDKGLAETGDNEWFLERTNSGTDFSRLYYLYMNNTVEHLPDLSKGIDFSEMFAECFNLKKLPPLNTPNGKSFALMFLDCYELTEVSLLDTSNGTDFDEMFSMCINLVTVNKINFTKSVYSLSSVFSECSNLENLTIEGTISQSFNIAHSEVITHDSLMSIVNALSEVTSTKTLTLGSTNIAKLTSEELAMITAKGWTYK